jgi:hypothetical protein
MNQSVQRMQRRMLRRRGQTVTLRRNTTPPLVLENVPARVMGDGAPEELVGGIGQKQIAAIILKESVTFPGGLKAGDVLIHEGQHYTLLTVDGATKGVYAYVAKSRPPT